ncbi:conserved hypothetical protein [Pediculus humanus corporis]|uniref:Uncharacterized protein n=1 Tax=Pediculus humanus subsp. corporis TaxID=121224 RepID=E0V9F9_PEDHC|nr:uncharacterized protein Phum_PHUM010750 [Pediculus humanus corporis]EEB10015.1 conserved hypothetical protein [Pediculus humanus corporis]
MSEVIQTVLGEVNPETVGNILTHEHMHIDYRKFFIPPPNTIKDYFEGEINLKNIGFIQRYPYSNDSNLSFFTEDLKNAVVDDLKIYKRLGGSLIVENTNHGINRNVEYLKYVSEQTGIHVVSGTGFYLESVQSNSTLNKNIEELCDVMIEDLIKGCPEMDDVKCGMIGEVASNYPISDFELRSIKATGIVQEELKCPVTFHPGRDKNGPFEIMRYYTESGGDGRKAIMSHLDRTLEIPDLIDFSNEYKCFLQHDLFGTEVLTYQLSPSYQMPSDYDRLKRIKYLIEEEKLLDRILMSHDIHTKHRLVNYGGHGYFHILSNVIPKMKLLNFTGEEIDKIININPKNWLKWKNPK